MMCVVYKIISVETKVEIIAMKYAGLEGLQVMHVIFVKNNKTTYQVISQW